MLGSVQEYDVWSSAQDGLYLGRLFLMMFVFATAQWVICIWIVQEDDRCL